MKSAMICFGLLAIGAPLAIAQEKAPAPCIWSTAQVGVPGSPVHLMPGVFNVFLKQTPPGTNPNPEFKGLVLVKVVSSEDGEITDACSLTHEDPSLTEAAVATVKVWKLRPYFLNGKPVKTESVVGIRFAGKTARFEPQQRVPDTHN